MTMVTSQTEVKAQFHQKEELKPALDTVKETTGSFLDKIHQAKMAGDEWVETTPEIIQFYNRKGLNGAKFFIYDGIKVCERGKIEEIEDEMNTPLSEKLHGKGEGVTSV